MATAAGGGGTVHPIAAESFNPELDAKILRKAMKGLGRYFQIH